MTSHGSQQLRRFRIARRDGASIEDAAEIAGIGIAEARLTDREDEKNPPPEDAFVLLGHNSEKGMSEQSTDSTSAQELSLLVERIERLTEERKGISEDIRDVYAEAKSRGFDAPTIRWAVRERAIDRNKRQ